MGARMEIWTHGSTGFVAMHALLKADGPKAALDLEGTGICGRGNSMTDSELSAAAIVRHHLKSPEERIENAEREIAICVANQKHPGHELGAMLGEIDWLAERQRLLEELGRESV